MKELNRLQVGDFKIEDSITINELKENIDKIITIEQFFSSKEKIILEDKKLENFLNGVKLEFSMQEDIYRIYDENENFIGLGVIKNNILKRDVIL